MAERSAFVLRINLHGAKVQDALAANEIMIGWAGVRGLLDPSLNWDGFRHAIQQTWPSATSSEVGRSAGQTWCFIRDMKPDDYVVVPDGGCFYVAKVLGPARYDESFVGQDAAYRRPVQWLNNGQPVDRERAPSALRSRMRARHTLARAGDLVDQIEEALRNARRVEAPSLERQMAEALRKQAVEVLRSPGAYLDERGFELLVKSVLERMEARVDLVPRSRDVGADLIAFFERLDMTVAVQCKYHMDPRWETGPEAVEQASIGCDKAVADVAWVVSCGRFSQEAQDRAAGKTDEGRKIRLVDGEELARLIVDLGIRLPASVGSEAP
jgi:predicted Mrr-cat superfamily restriction endonuclease